MVYRIWMIWTVHERYMYFFCFLTEVSNQSLNNMYDSEVEIMWWILRDQWDQGLKLGYWNKDWDFSIRRVIDQNWASLNIGCLALWPEFTVPLPWYFDPWHIRDQHFGSCLLNFHSAFWLLEPYFSLQPSCCKICVFFIRIYLLLLGSLFLRFFAAWIPKSNFFPLPTFCLEIYMVKSHLSRNFTKLKVPFFSASRPWRSSTCQRCCCYRSAARWCNGWFVSWIRKYPLVNVYIAIENHHL